MTKIISIIDYGAGNIHSCKNAFAYAGKNYKAYVGEKYEEADYLILPGVGAFKTCIEGLKAQEGLIEILNNHILNKQKPFMGICVGMQMLADISYEKGEFEGLGLINGSVHKMQQKDLKIPHMGWNNVSFANNSFYKSLSNKDFYFVHSYHFSVKDSKTILSTTNYGQDFIASVEKDNILAVQFHPEKSQENGLKLIEMFLNR